MTDQSHRLEQGGLIDRDQPLRFTFDGKSYVGYQGDTLASALLANGVKLVGRSFKYHRPRGFYTAGSEEPNALVTLRTGARSEPNTRATVVELYDGLVASSQNRWPSLNFDLLSINSRFSSLLPAGFYYKTFIWPGQKGWMFYEKFIRRAAGLGVASREPDPDRYEKCHAFCDVLVVGAGPAGLAAALAAGRSGARVLLVDENPIVGGSMLHDTQDIDGRSPVELSIDIGQQLAELDNVRIMTRTTAYGLFDSNVVGMIEHLEDDKPVPDAHMPRQRSWIVRARRIVFATGAIERPLVFGNNDLPGIMLAQAARRYVNQYGVRVAKRVVFFTNNDSVYETAIDFVEAGIEVAAIIDARASLPSHLSDFKDRFGVNVVRGHVVTKARGGKELRSVEIAALSADGTVSSPKKVSCDLLCVSGGWAPNVHLHSHLGGRPVFDDALLTFVAPEDANGRFSAGAVAGRWELGECLNMGLDAGQAAAVSCGLPVEDLARYESDGPDTGNTLALWEVPARGRTKKFVDIQDDVAASDVALASSEGYRSVEHLKRYTTLGMGTDQGKTSNINGLAILAQKRGETIPAVGTTTFRPPYVPVALGAIAGEETGRHFRPTRLSPIHGWHERHGAVWITAGAWLRPRYYPRGNESLTDGYIREMKHVREKVGMVDVSTLGKIDIQGPDAGEFLNRIYVNGFGKLPVGKARYGIMLREDGIVYDDGTTSRLSENHYFMTTTTANAAGVMAKLEYYLQVIWPDLKVDVTSVTEQWAGMAISGPRSRDVLSGVLDGIALDNESLPFMGVARGRLDGAPVMILRISFSGELAYELYTPSGFGEAVWARIMEAGATHEIIPYGTEALGAMRIEKGHVAGPELDGRTTLEDLGLEKMASSRKPFIGNVLRMREGLQAANRERLVGLRPLSKNEKLRQGALVVEQDAAHMDSYSIGKVTSTTFSPAAGQDVALGLVRGGKSRIGDVVDVIYPLRDERVAAEIVDPVFYDKDGDRLHA